MSPHSIVNIAIQRSAVKRLFLTVISLSLLSACAASSARTKPPEGKGKGAVPVVVAEVTQQTVPLQIRAIGNVEPNAVVSVKSQVNGELTGVYFRQGQDVKKGDLLFKIDSRPFEATLMQAIANQSKDIANVKQAQAKLASDKTAVEQAQAKLAADTASIKAAKANLNKNITEAKQAGVEANRYASLLKAGAISKNQYDQYRATAEAQNATTSAGSAGVENAESQVRASAAAVEQAKAAVGASAAAVENAQAAVNADKAAIDSAKIQLSYTSIYAPMDGRTGSLFVTQGNLIKASDTTPMVTINQVHPIFVSFAVPQQQLPQIRQYQAQGSLKVNAIVPKDPTHPVSGRLTFIDNAVDNTTGTVKLKAIFDNPEERLWPGQFVNVILELNQDPNAIVVPSVAVQTGQKGQYVFVLQPDLTVKQQPVVVSRTVNDLSVISQGLQPKEKVVTDGTLNLIPGAKVALKNQQPRKLTF
jgi:multidrug efflux system membrane fusion protein